MRKAFNKYNRDLYKYNRRSREYAFNKKHKSHELRRAFKKYNRDHEKYQRELRKLQFKKYGAKYFTDGYPIATAVNLPQLKDENLQKAEDLTKLPTTEALQLPTEEKVELGKFVVNLILQNPKCNSLSQISSKDDPIAKNIASSVKNAINDIVANQVVDVIVNMGEQPTAGYGLGSYPRCKKGKPCADPTVASIENGTYPLARFLQFYVNQKPGEKLEPLVFEFVQYALSKEGQEVVIKDGYIPLNKAQVDDVLAQLNK